jgi:hypothetical protein
MNRPCRPYPDDATFKTIALYCERCKTTGECWDRYLRWEKDAGITLNKSEHHTVDE